MTRDEVNKLVDAGEIICLAEYWSGGLETIQIRDKKNPDGPRRAAHIVKETILTTKDSVSVSRFLRDDEKPELWKPSAKRREKVCVQITGFLMEKGNRVLNGIIHPLS